ncbi:SAP domain-containing protein [Perilla frutescens var. hirtella]|nr:SAP domain-containing protein [Perilla frutescens var. hirtella]
MTDEKSKKRFVVEISSDESNSPPSECDGGVAEEISSSTSCDDDDDWSDWNNSDDEDNAEVSVDEDREIDDVDKPDEESMCNKVIRFIEGRSDMQELRVDECKAYLRTHRLRLSGTKEECIERIKEHWKLKDGNGEIFYPRSSFRLDCTGDVCKGDIVLFHQRVHQTSGKTARNRTVGRRTVAGRIIKESYGATRQQHTFTVEVLWNRGTKKLDPLFPLLVKGRNLYRLKTFRQLWQNEKERVEVLAEKHRRGNAARSIRAMKRTKGVTRKNEPLAFKGTQYSWNLCLYGVSCFLIFLRVPQHCKRVNHLGSSRTRERSPGKKNFLNEQGEFAKNKKRIHSHHSAPVSSKRKSRGSAHHSRHHDSPDQVRQSPSLSYNHHFAPFSSKRNAGSRDFAPHSHRRHHNSHDQVRQSPSLSYYYPAQTSNHFESDVFPREPHNLHYHGGFASVAELPYSSTRHTSRWQETSHGSCSDPSYSHSKNENEAAASFNYPRFTGNRQSFRSTTENHRWR